ncbi:helix-turn-helix transcriptional regulator [Streptomyces sp. NPDC127072]|uniref:helix-turn-helix transcriptional regulator n=1 Tax=Streptomyces sp. NPDC127072 TaxID=3347129 RepID=UPI00365ABE17
MTTSTARVLALLEILQGGGIRTVPDLAARLDVDERTVRRYAGHLLELGVPVESVRGRYGGYRLAPGYRMPPLMLTDEEALAVLLGLLTGRRAGLVTTSVAASESATAKLLRVLPRALGRRLDALLETADFTTSPRPGIAPEAEVLLELAEAARHQRPVVISYTDRKDRRSDRTVLPYGLVAHSGRWYLTGADPSGREVRTFRLDRITALSVQSGSFTVPADFDPTATVLDSLAHTPWTHDVSLRIRDSVQHLRKHLPAGIATLSAIPPTTTPGEAGPADTAEARSGGAGDSAAADEDTGWIQVRIRAERLDWIPPVLAALDRPFVIEHPAALRDLVRALARRLGEYAAVDPGAPQDQVTNPPRDTPASEAARDSRG